MQYNKSKGRKISSTVCHLLYWADYRCHRRKDEAATVDKEKLNLSADCKFSFILNLSHDAAAD
jgi:hypothetical protein